MNILSDFFSWLIGDDVIDGYITSLPDIPISDAERYETAQYDRMASRTAEDGREDDTPIGKQVW